MFDFIGNLFWQKKSDREEEEEGFDQGYHDLPPPKVRASMSPEKLAILLSEQQAGTPAYILVEHELNLRIAQVQARATYKASYVGVVGVVVGIAATAFLSWLQTPPPPKSTGQEIHACCERDTNGTAKVGRSQNIPSGSSPVVPGVQPAKQPAQQQQANPNK